MITKTEKQLRFKKIAKILQEKNISAIIICSNVNLLYIGGFIFSGYAIVNANGDGVLLSRNKENDTIPFQKPVHILNLARENGVEIGNNICFDDESMSVGDYLFLNNCFKDYTIVTSANVLRLARMIKTPFEIEQIKASAKVNDTLYAAIPMLYKEGMSDIQLGIEIEHYSRNLGHLGLFRSFGGKMECFMGTLLAGDNALSPSPFDFALGGAGADSSCPIGACGNKILQNQTIMVDYSGNINGYLSDMSRIYCLGELPEIAYIAHNVTEQIHEKCCELITQKAPANLLWESAKQIADDNNLSEYFMGYEKQSKFSGHGLGLEINELPVLTAKDTTPLCEGMILAIEPKFAIPGIGAVGNEDTYLVTKNGFERLTNANRNIIKLI